MHKNNESILNFAKNYALGDGLVKKAIEHLLGIQRRETIWANQRKINQKQKSEKTYDDYNWKELIAAGSLEKLTVLDKYLNHHKLPKSGKKIDKVKHITCHICWSTCGHQAIQTLIQAQETPE